MVHRRCHIEIVRHGHVGFAVVAERNVQAFEACEFFEIAETDARQVIRETAQRGRLSVL